MSLLVLPQHEQFYPEGLAPFPLGWIKVAPKFKDFSATTAIFKDFQGACGHDNELLPLFICKLCPF